MNYIYFIELNNKIKIGTTVDLKSRVKNATSSHPDTQFLTSFEGDKVTETCLHKHFQKIRATGEWFYKTNELTSFIDEIKKGTSTFIDDLKKEYFARNKEKHELGVKYEQKLKENKVILEWKKSSLEDYKLILNSYLQEIRIRRRNINLFNIDIIKDTCISNLDKNFFEENYTYLGSQIEACGEIIDNEKFYTKFYIYFGDKYDPISMKLEGHYMGWGNVVYRNKQVISDYDFKLITDYCFRFLERFLNRELLNCNQELEKISKLPDKLLLDTYFESLKEKHNAQT